MRLRGQNLLSTIALFVDKSLIDMRSGVVCGVVCTDSPDVMRFLRHVIGLCFPDNLADLFNHTDGRYATSPLALIDILHRLQRLITGGCE